MLFAKIHTGDPSIRIPAVIAERSASRVLTSEFMDGENLEWAAAQPEALRRTFAETLWRFVFRGNLVGGVFNAGPAHPGNYLFHPAGHHRVPGTLVVCNRSASSACNARVRCTWPRVGSMRRRFGRSASRCSAREAAVMNALRSHIRA